MVRCNRIWTVGAVSAIGVAGLLTLAGCNSTKQPPTTAGSAPTAMPASAKAGYGGLQTVVANTKAAVEAGDYPKAQAEFNRFEEAWKPVEDGIKAKSPDSYDKIEASMDEITGGIKTAQPDRKQVLTALQSLDQTIASIP